MALEPNREDLKDRLYRITELAEELKKTPGIATERIAKRGAEIEKHSRWVTRALGLST